jgi:hypothetical protein
MAITGTAAVPTPKGYLTRAELAERLGIQPTTIEKAKNLNSRLWQQIKKLLDVKNISRREFYSVPKKSDINEIKKFSGQQARTLPRETYKGEKNTITKIRELLNKSDKKYNIKELDKIITGNIPRTSEDATNTVRTAFSTLRQDPVYRNKLATIDPKQVGRNVAEFYTQKNKEGILSVREILVADPDADLTQITKDLFGKEFENASPIKKEQLMRKSSRYVQNFLGAVSNSTSAKPLIKEFKPIKPDILGDILENIESNIGEFGYGAGERRRMQFNIADAARGLPENTTIYERLKLGRLDRVGKALDEVVGVASTFREAPGYIETSQIIPKKINVEKGKIIDSAFSRAFNKALNGDYSAVKEYNKLANDFARKNPGVDVARIKTGKNLKPEKEIAFFEDYSEAAKKNIKELAKDKNIVIQTKSKPLGLMIEELGKTSKLRKAGLAAIPAYVATKVYQEANQYPSDDLYAQASMSDVEYGDPDTWGMKVGQFIEEKPYTSGALGIGTAATTKLGRKAIGQILKTGLPIRYGPTGVAYDLATADYSDPMSRLYLEGELAIAPATVKGTSKAAAQASRIFGANPAVRRFLERAVNLGARAPTALRFARVASPIGLASLGLEGLYYTYKKAKETQDAIAAMSEEEKQNYLSEQELQALMGEAEFATGGRVQMSAGGIASMRSNFETGGPGDKKKTTPLLDKPTIGIDPFELNKPVDLAKRDTLKGAGILGAGIAAGKLGLLKLFKSAKAAKAAKVAPLTKIIPPLGKTMTQFPEWFPTLISKVRKEGKQIPIYKEVEVTLTKPEYDKLSKEGAKVYDRHLGRTDWYKEKLKKEGVPRYYTNKKTNEIIGYEYEIKDLPDVKVTEYGGEELTVSFPNAYGKNVTMEYTPPKGTKDATFKVDDAVPEWGASPDDAPDFYAETVNSLDEVYGGASRIEQKVLKLKKPRTTQGDEVVARAEAQYDYIKDTAGDLDEF